MGLGDFVADGIHIVTGIEPCGGCEQRRQKLNAFGDRVVNKIDLLRGRGNVGAMLYDVTLNTQKTYRVEAQNEDEALKLVQDGKGECTFTAATHNIRPEPKAGTAAALTASRPAA